MSAASDSPGTWITKSHVKEIKAHLRPQQQQQEDSTDAGAKPKEDPYRNAYDSCLEILGSCKKNVKEGDRVPAFVEFLLLEDQIEVVSGEEDRNEGLLRSLHEGNRPIQLENVENNTVKTFALLFGQASRKLDDYVTAERCFEWILWSRQQNNENVADELHAWKGLADTLREAIAPPASRPALPNTTGDFPLEKCIIMTSRRRERLKGCYSILAESSRDEGKPSKQATYLLKESEICIRCGQPDQALTNLGSLLELCASDAVDRPTFSRLVETCGMGAFYKIQMGADFKRGCDVLSMFDERGLMVPLLDVLERYYSYQYGSTGGTRWNSTGPADQSEVLQSVRLLLSCALQRDASHASPSTAQRVAERLKKFRKLLVEPDDATGGISQCQLLLAGVYFSCLSLLMQCDEPAILRLCSEERQTAHSVIESIMYEEQSDTKTCFQSDILFTFRSSKQMVYYSEHFLEGLVLLLGAFTIDVGSISGEAALHSQRRLRDFSGDMSSLFDTHSLAYKGAEFDHGIHKLFNCVALSCGSIPMERALNLLYSPAPILQLADYVLEASIRRKRVSTLPVPLIDQWNCLGVERFCNCEGKESYLDSQELIHLAIDVFFHYFKQVWANNLDMLCYWDILVMEKFVHVVRHAMWLFSGSNLLVLDAGVCPDYSMLGHEFRSFFPLHSLVGCGLNQLFSQSNIRSAEFETQGDVLVEEALGASECRFHGDAPGRQLKLSGWMLVALRLFIKYLPAPECKLLKWCIGDAGGMPEVSMLQAVDNVWCSLSCAAVELMIEWVLVSVDNATPLPLKYYIQVLARCRESATLLTSSYSKDVAMKSLSDFADLSIRLVLASDSALMHDQSAFGDISTDLLSTVRWPQLADVDLSVLRGTMCGAELRQIPFAYRYGQWKRKQFVNEHNADDREEYLKMAQQALLSIANSGIIHCDTLASLADVFYERLKESVRTLEPGSSVPERVVAIKERGTKLAKKALSLYSHHAHAAKSLCDILVLWGSYNESINFMYDYIGLWGASKSIWACLVTAKLHEYGLTNDESPEKSFLRRSQRKNGPHWMTEACIAERSEEALHNCIDCLHMVQRAGANGWKTWKQLAEIYLLLGKLTASQKAVAKCLLLQVLSREQQIEERLSSYHIFSSEISPEACASLRKPQCIAAPPDAVTHCYDADSLFLAARINSSLSQHKFAVIRYEMGLSLQGTSAAALYGCAQSHLAIAKSHLEEGTVSVALAHIKTGIARASMLVGRIPVKVEQKEHAQFLRAYRNVAAAWNLIGELYSCTFHICPEMYGPEAALISLGIVPQKEAFSSTVVIDDENFVFPSKCDPMRESPTWDSQLPVYIGPRGRVCLELSGAVTSMTEGDEGCYVYVYSAADGEGPQCYATCASAAFSNAVRCEPENADHWCDLARSFWYQAQAIRAAMGVSSVPLMSVECHTESKEVCITRMQSRHLARRLARRAAAAYEKAIKLAPRYARAWNGYGCAVENPLVAQHALIRAVHLGGGGTSLCNLGMIYIENGQLKLAKSTLLQAQTHDPNNDSMWVGHGFVSEAQAMLAALRDSSSASSSDFLRFRSRAAAAFISATDLTLSAFASVPASIYGSNYVQPLHIDGQPCYNYSPGKSTSDKALDSSSLLYVGCMRAPTNVVALYAKALDEASSENFPVARKWAEACISRILVMMRMGFLGESVEDQRIQTLLEKMLYNVRIFLYWVELSINHPTVQLREGLSRNIKEASPPTLHLSAERVPKSQLHVLISAIVKYVSGDEPSTKNKTASSERKELLEDASAAALLNLRLDPNASCDLSVSEDTFSRKKSHHIALARFALTANTDGAVSLLKTLIDDFSCLDCETSKVSLAACLFLDTLSLCNALRGGLCRTVRNSPWNYDAWAKLGVLALHGCFSGISTPRSSSNACSYAFDASWKYAIHETLKNRQHESTNPGAEDEASTSISPYELMRLKTVASMYDGSTWTSRSAARYFHACPWKQSAWSLISLEQYALSGYYSSALEQDVDRFPAIGHKSEYPVCSARTIQNLAESGLETFVESRSVEDMLLCIHSALNQWVATSQGGEAQTKKSRQSLKMKVLRLENCLRRTRVALPESSLVKSQRAMFSAERNSLSLVDWRKRVLVDSLNGAAVKLEALRQNLSTTS
eukprot:gb/GECG01004263.1/.p1 GENE.gb/GECG01004263.1/~~gb/GECG01004263.1/.p1  ORF type:complete len:2147 (+),score=229.32 gb/GECG01004263.1/:1-6441(+)